MSASGRHLLAPLLCVASCVALNPAYEDSASSGGASGKTSASSTTGVASSANTTEASDTTGGSAGSTGGTAADLESTTAGVPPGQVQFLDEAWEGQFGAGVQIDGFDWNGIALQLDDAIGSATFESRVFDSGSDATAWDTLQWGPRAAYGLPLDPANAWQADQYPEGEVGAANLSLLLNFEGGPWEPMATVLDQSAAGYDGTWNGASTAAQADGIFGGGFANPDGEGGERIDFADGNHPGHDGFTWTLWFRAMECPGNQTMIALDSPTVSAPLNTGTTFIGCDYRAECTGSSTRRYAYAGIQGAGGAVARVCGTTPIDDGEWHFVALRRRVSNNTQVLDVIVDHAEPVSSSDALGITDVAIHAGSDAETFTVSGGNADSEVVVTTYPGRGEYDQVALWNRELPDQELYALYERGARRVRVQVRACAQPDCDDQEFVGPNAETARSFLDPGPNAEHAIDLSPLGLSGRYFQYRIDMQRREDVTSPATAFVRVLGHRD